MANLKKIEKFLQENRKRVYRVDSIQHGTSVKIEHLTSHRAAISTATKLKQAFPKHKVRIMYPTQIYRDGFSVRIWI
jgi:hypothetical protein